MTTPAPSVISSCPSPGVGAYSGCYFNGTTLSCAPYKTTIDSQLMNDWSNAYAGRPDPLSNFSVRYQGIFNFATAGTYDISVVTSDGMRVYIDGIILIDSWKDQPPSMYTVTKNLGSGNHLIVVEFYSHTGSPVSYLWWNRK